MHIGWRRVTNGKQIGFKHGNEAKLQVSRTISFYSEMFQESAKMDWEKVKEVAMSYEPVMRMKWPHYLEEINGQIQF